MSFFYNKKEAEIELTNTRNYWIDRFFKLSVCISAIPLDVNIALKYKDLIIKDIQEDLLAKELTLGGENVKKKLSFYSCLDGTFAYLMVWSKALASVMYYVYELNEEFVDKKETTKKISQMLFIQFSKENGLLSEMKDSFFDYKEYVVNYLRTQ